MGTENTTITHLLLFQNVGCRASLTTKNNTIICNSAHLKKNKIVIRIYGSTYGFKILGSIFRTIIKSKSSSGLQLNGVFLFSELLCNIMP